jgi:hypothetical protein
MRRDDDERDEDDDADDGWDNDTDIDDADDDDSTVPCPFCGHEIFEDTPRCPACERYLSPEDFARPRRPLWVIVTAVVCLLIALWLAFATF